MNKEYFLDLTINIPLTIDKGYEAPVNEPFLSGDADLDGKVGISDVVKVMMYVANKDANPISEQGVINADVYNSGDGVFISDALSIQKKVAQIIVTLPES
ncbi:MAG: hypothetical protein ACI4J2_09010 [Ruminococcus sp.]